MPSPRKSPRKTKSPLDQDKYTAELTSGQLVIGVVILIVFGLACFMLGVLVGRFEPEDRPEFARSAPRETSTSGKGPVAEAGGTSQPASKEASRGASALRPPPAEKAPASKASAKKPAARKPATEKPAARASRPSAKPSTTAKRATETKAPVPPPRVSEASDAGKPGDAASSGDTPPKNEKAPGPEVVALPKPPAAAGTAKQGPPPPGRAKKFSEALRLLEPAEELGAGSASQPPPPGARNRPALSMPYTVQVGAYSKRKNADAVRKRVEGKTSFGAEVVESDDGRLIVVWVGSFSDHASAEKARAELSDKHGFAGCFVEKR